MINQNLNRKTDIENSKNKQAYGLASRRFHVANNSHTKFDLGSVSKLFMSVAIAQLAQKNKISLSDKAVKYVPKWLPQKQAKSITIQNLLNHTSGLTNFMSDKRFKLGGDSGLFVKVDDYKPIIRSEKLAFKPGTSQMYSNVGYIVLGAIIEKVTGQDYFDYIRDHVFKPAHMKQAGFYRKDKPIKNLAIGYVPKQQGSHIKWRNNLFSSMFKGSPAGGAYASSLDLYHFAQALLNHDLVSKAYTNRLLGTTIQKPNDQDAVHVGHKLSHGIQYKGLFTQHGFAGAWNEFGFAVWHHPPRVGHTGGLGGVDDYIAIFPKSHYVIIVLSNTTNRAKLHILSTISSLLGYQFRNFNL